MSRCSDKILSRLSEKHVLWELSHRTGIPKSALQRYAVGETEKFQSIGWNRLLMRLIRHQQN